MEIGDLQAEIRQLQQDLAAAKAGRTAAAERADAAARKIGHLEALLDIVPVGVVMADNSGKVLLGNKRVAAMLRHHVLLSDTADSYGEWIAYHPDGRRVASHEYPMARVLRGECDRPELRVQYQRGDGTRLWLRIVGQPIFGNDGERIGAAVALIDVEDEQALMDRQNILIAELNHRVKNAFSVVKSIVSLSLRKTSDREGLRETIDRRLDAYVSAHARLMATDWENVGIGTIVDEIVRPIAEQRVRAAGPDITLPARAALALSMALYELATNALKHGALSSIRGRVDLGWSVEARDDATYLRIDWVERGGPSPVHKGDNGFGWFVLTRALMMETRGSVDFSLPAAGCEWRFSMPLEQKSQDSK